MKIKGKFLALTLLFSIAFVPAAFAGLAAIGPPDPVTGFPQYYTDTLGVSAWLPVPPFGVPAVGGAIVTPPTMIFDAVTADPFSATVGFGTEAFYWVTTSVINTPAFGKITFRAGVEASFAGGVAVTGQQTAFSRLRVRFPSAPVPGDYTIQHPFGTEIVTVTAADITRNKGINFTRDITLPTPLVFSGPLTGDVGPFLTQLLPLPAVAPGTPPPFDTGWIGDGVTLATVTGSPTGFNKVRVTAPVGVDLDGAGNNFIESDQFTTSGIKFPGTAVPPGGGVPPVVLPTPLTVTAVNFVRTANNVSVNIFATAPVGAVVTTVINGQTFTLTGDGAGNFFVAATFARPKGFVLPPTLAVTAQAGTAPATTINAPIVDQVTITSALYRTLKKELFVSASSSDQTTRPILTVTNPPVGGNGKGILSTTFKNVTLPPPNVTVHSSMGGNATAAVTILP